MIGKIKGRATIRRVSGQLCRPLAEQIRLYA
jgi:hypothetical protein